MMIGMMWKQGKQQSPLQANLKLKITFLKIFSSAKKQKMDESGTEKGELKRLTIKSKVMGGTCDA